MGNIALKVSTGVDPVNTDFARATVTRSNGIAYAAAYLTDNKIHIYEISADKTTVTDRIAITPNTSDTPQRITLGLFQSDNSIALAYQDGLETLGNKIKYTKVNSSTWVAPTWETAATSISPSWFSNFDMDVSDTGLVSIAYLYVGSNSCQLNVISKATTGGAWVNQQTQLYSSPIRRRAGECVSVVCLGVSGGVRDVIVAAGATNQNADLGVQLYTCRVTEATASTTALTSRATYMVDTIAKSDTTNARRRHCKIYRDSGSAWCFVGMSMNTRGQYFSRGTFATSTFVTTQSLQSALLTDRSWAGMAITYGAIQGGTGPTFWIKDTSGVVWSTATKSTIFGTVIWPYSNGRAFPNVSTQTAIDLSDNAAPFPSVTDNDLILQQSDSVAGTTTIWDHWSGFPVAMPGGNSGIVSLTPANGTINVEGNPALAAQVDLDLRFGESQYNVEYQFASDVTFTTNVQTYLSTVQQYVDGTDTPGVFVTFSEKMTAITLGKAAWFYRARLVDGWGNRGAWTASQSFTVGHPPSAIPTSPTESGYFNWNGGLRTYTWQFTDPSANDFQTAYQVQVISSTGVVLQDSGKVASAAFSYSPAALAGTAKDTQLSWKVQVWDSTDTTGGYSDPQQFILTDPITITITSPASGATVATGNPVFVFSVATGGGRRVKGYSVVVTQGSAIVYAGPVVQVDLASGTTVRASMPPNVLANNQGYTLQITAVDDVGMVGVSAATPFSVAWTPPATPGAVTVDVSGYDVEGLGYNEVTWPDTGRGTAFTHWTVYRKDDLIDPNTGTVISSGTFQAIYQDYDLSSLYVYRDYFAPANQYKSTYAVSQWTNVAGQDAESLMSQSAVVISVSAAYWLINQNGVTNTADTLKMSIVTDESYTEEQEEAEFTVVGRGRVVNRGQYLGPKGSLTSRLRNTGNTTARQKRLALLAIQQGTGVLFLRNPFGDTWSVNMSNMQVSRLAGVGAQEFCDVTIPYAEVS